MIPQRYHVDAVGAQLVKKVLCDPAAPGDVLAVGDHQIDRMLPHHSGQPLLHHLPPRSADNIAQAQNTKRHHWRRYPCRGSVAIAHDPRSTTAAEETIVLATAELNLTFAFCIRTLQSCDSSRRTPRAAEE